MKKHLVRILVGLVLVSLALLHSAGFLPLPLLKQLELWSYDHRLIMTMPQELDDRIVIVDIDEKSLAQIGRWPWSRNTVAKMVDQLFDDYQIAALGFDVVFAEPDTSSGIKELEQLAQGPLSNNPSFQQELKKSRTRLDYDALLANSFRDRPVVLGYYFSGQADGSRTSGLLPEPLPVTVDEQPALRWLHHKTGFGANIPLLQQAATLGGHFNPDPDRDGVTRRVPMLQEYQGGYYESLSLAVLRAMFGLPELLPGAPADAPEQLEWLQVADLVIPVDGQASALIPYRGYQGSFHYISAADILSGNIAKDELEGAIVLVGTTAPGLMDLRSTPVSAVYAGVEIHANMIAGMLDGSIRHAPGYARAADLVMLLIGGLLLTLLLPMLGPLTSLGITLAVLILAGFINWYAWQQGLVLPLATQILLFPLLFAFNTSYGFLVESRSRRQITGLFGQYVPPEIVNTMSKDPAQFTMAAEARGMTVLFTDMVGFTSISEKLTPQELASFMNEYLTAMTEIIYQYGGTVDKYIGDAIMAFWGAPLDDPDHAIHAIQAATAMRKRLVSLSSDMVAKGYPELQIGVGVNSGIMRVGNMGSSYRVAYTVMGDAVNLASRLEGLTRQYGIWLIAGQDTRSMVDGYVWRELDQVRVKGKVQPVAIFEPCGEELLLENTYLYDITSFNKMVAAYRQQNWQQAAELLDPLITDKPDLKLYQLYKQRIEQYQQEPPGDDWDGVCTFTTK
jgi:adenylate cyclase